MTLTDQSPTRTRVEKQLVGKPIKVGERRVQPVARIAGWYGANRSEEGSGLVAWLRVSPLEVVVRESDGSEHRVPITDPTREALRGIASGALLVAGLCWLLMLVAKIGRARMSKKEKPS